MNPALEETEEKLTCNILPLLANTRDCQTFVRTGAQDKKSRKFASFLFRTQKNVSFQKFLVIPVVNTMGLIRNF